MLVEIIAVKASHSNRKNIKKNDIKEDEYPKGRKLPHLKINGNEDISMSQLPVFFKAIKIAFFVEF